MKLSWDNIGPTLSHGYVGKWACFYVKERRVFQNKEVKFILRIYLPGLKDTYFLPDKKACQKKATELLKYWVKEFKR